MSSPGLSCRTQVTSWSRTCHKRPSCSTRLSTVSWRVVLHISNLTLLAVRFVPGDAAQSPMFHKPPPFAVHGARNVFLDTVKRGLDDDFKSKSGPASVVLRIYEAFGGHAQVSLRIAKHIPVSKVLATNLLEDPEAELSVLETEDRAHHVVKLNFHGFEVKTIKVVLGKSDVSV